MQSVHTIASSHAEVAGEQFGADFKWPLEIHSKSLDFLFSEL